MARRKPEKIFPVRSLSEANGALSEIGYLKRQITLVETRMNTAIDQAKAKAQQLAAPLQGRIAEIEAGLAAFAEFNKAALFADRRSQELDHGSFGYRKSSQIKPKVKTTWAMVLGRLKELKFDSAIRIKEEPNKEELETWPAERLSLVGARRIEKDAFWYEVNEEKIKEKS